MPRSEWSKEFEKRLDRRVRSTIRLPIFPKRWNAFHTLMGYGFTLMIAGLLVLIF